MSSFNQEKLFLKVVVIGDSGVGKTSLTYSFVCNKFRVYYASTIPADFYSKEVQLEEDSFVTLQIWDTAGQERFNSLGPCFYRGADACMLVYDVTNKDSFENIEKWRETFIKSANLSDPENFPFVVVGNKIDLNKNEVHKDTVENWCSKYSIPFFETSAKECIVEKPFNIISKIAWKRNKSLIQDEIELKENENNNGFINQYICLC
eukprot:TRINITY_DN1476_c1_g1_i2.p1 TRINITY_DN1476_c1_g1~~TRINITY_DN1476_c1_g1_i2.p1  ORF type:complete len:206 (-),score=45.65 TRINITY_DN1476_c1_g1_i2:58-675(-)